MSLTSEDLEDIKQLLDTSLSQQEKRMEKRFEKIDQRFEQLEQRIDERFEEVDDKLNEIMNAVGGEFTEHTTRIDDHEERITTLKTQAA